MLTLEKKSLRWQRDKTIYSTLELSGSVFKVDIRLYGRVSPRIRRCLLLIFYRQIREKFSAWDCDSELIHSHDLSYYSYVPDSEVSLKQALRLKTKEEKYGFEIRIKRLDLGWSQERLAEKTGLNRVYISDIERGKYRVTTATRDRIERALCASRSDTTNTTKP
jgi:DNA-binding XRE family transcriptional regulator